MRMFDLHGDMMGWLKAPLRSSKSALHGLIHWLSQTYCAKGITVNGIAPALIQDTAMLPGGSEELAKSKSHVHKLSIRLD